VPETRTQRNPPRVVNLREMLPWPRMSRAAARQVMFRADETSRFG